MALILDKTFTGVIETIVITGLTNGITGITYNESGWTETIFIEENIEIDITSGYTEMTYITGLTMLSYTTESGNILENPYLAVDFVSVNKYSKEYNHKFPIIIGLLLYRDENARKIEFRDSYWEKKYYVQVDSTIYDEYFSTSCLLNTCVYKKSYEYINTLYPGWKSDEL